MRAATIAYQGDLTWFSQKSTKGIYSVVTEALENHLKYITRPSELAASFNLDIKKWIGRAKEVVYKHANSRVAAKKIFALPNDLNPEEGRSLLLEFLTTYNFFFIKTTRCTNGKRKTIRIPIVLDENDIGIAVHDPKQTVSGRRNLHAHVVIFAVHSGSGRKIDINKAGLRAMYQGWEQFLERKGYEIRNMPWIEEPHFGPERLRKESKAYSAEAYQQYKAFRKIREKEEEKIKRTVELRIIEWEQEQTAKEKQDQHSAVLLKNKEAENSSELPNLFDFGDNLFDKKTLEIFREVVGIDLGEKLQREEPKSDFHSKAEPQKHQLSQIVETVKTWKEKIFNVSARISSFAGKAKQQVQDLFKSQILRIKNLQQIKNEEKTLSPKPAKKPQPKENQRYLEKGNLYEDLESSISLEKSLEEEELLFDEKTLRPSKRTIKKSKYGRKSKRNGVEKEEKRKKDSASKGLYISLLSTRKLDSEEQWFDGEEDEDPDL